MNKLPQDASELTREAKHRELLGLDDEASGVSDQASGDTEVDVLALLADARRLTPDASGASA